MFITDQTTTGLALPFSYNIWLVIFSYAISAFASFAAFRLVARLKKSSSTRERMGWLMTASIALGAGIWTMHFIAMLAVDICGDATFSASLTFLSVVFAILASAIALHLVASGPLAPHTILFGGIAMGGGIGLMHYTGMASMQMGVKILYDLNLFVFSILVAAVLASLALWLLGRSLYAGQPARLPLLVVMAGVMGLAITVMHYTGMAATSFIPLDGIELSRTAIRATEMAVLVGVTTIFLVTLALLATISNLIENWAIMAVTIISFIVLAATRFSEGFFEIIAEGEYSVFREIFPAMAIFAAALVVFAFRQAHILERELAGRKEAEREVVNQRDELAKLNSQKDRFFAIIAHDLKTPFNALLAYSDILSTEADHLDKRQVVDYSNMVHSAGVQAYKLLEDLLDWSRLQLDRMDFSPRAFEIRELVGTNLVRYQPVADRKKITLLGVSEFNEWVTADSAMVDTILRNLISNAIKFTRQNGSIHIAVAPKDEWLEITVSDNGIGMSQEKVSDLFDLGKKVSTNGTEGEFGTGLGLQLCLELVERHKGAITVESEEGKGTAFHFTLPLADEQPVTLDTGPVHAVGNT